MHQLLLATRNSHKTREFAEILGDEFEVRDLADAAELPAVAETGLTFEENAILKAVETSKHFQGLVVADDSGLAVDVLNGAPGIYSARYAGEGATDAENMAKLLAELAGCDPAAGPPAARFQCALALAQEGKILGIFEGAIEGRIVREPRGSAGFGYDPVFEPSGFARTFGELSSAEKHRISHRARAIRALRTALMAKFCLSPG
ncbi:MAG TPA: RdgB/HAM1 family non-canonical purine NTP pyrophosphatase [Chthoniobacterales bacterium]|nr:RdgB/HAM1 family non-canonical purine NTP pyrophosphatase [Chthoniobacterales bacterium]